MNHRVVHASVVLLLATCGGMAMTGCVSSEPKFEQAPTTQPVRRSYEKRVEAEVAPPKGWKPVGLETGERHRELSWESPSGRVVYGVVRFDMPFPAPRELVITGYVNDIAKSEGKAELISRLAGPTYTRFIVAGTKHISDVKLTLRGTKGWFVYYRTPSPPYTEESPKASVAEVGDAMTARDATLVAEDVQR